MQPPPEPAAFPSQCPPEAPSGRTPSLLGLRATPDGPCPVLSQRALRGTSQACIAAPSPGVGQGLATARCSCSTPPGTLGAQWSSSEAGGGAGRAFLSLSCPQERWGAAWALELLPPRLAQNGGSLGWLASPLDPWAWTAAAAPASHIGETAWTSGRRAGCPRLTPVAHWPVAGVHQSPPPTGNRGLPPAGSFSSGHPAPAFREPAALHVHPARASPDLSSGGPLGCGMASAWGWTGRPGQGWAPASRTAAGASHEGAAKPSQPCTWCGQGQPSQSRVPRLTHVGFPWGQEHSRPPMRWTPRLHLAPATTTPHCARPCVRKRHSGTMGFSTSGS